MTLRIMLLGLVASMGFELPSGADLSRWTQSGSEWVGARLADRSVQAGEADRPCNLPTDCLQADATCHAPIVVERTNSPEDQVFEAVANKMAADFAADLIAGAAEPKPTEVAPMLVEVEELPTCGLPSGEEAASQVVVEEKKVEVAAVVAEPSMPVEVTEVTDPTHERLDRIATAVRLTREAVQAWADVIQDQVDETSPTR